MEKLFGTDGVRGLANVELSPLLALQIGSAAAHVIVETQHKGKMLIGRDPRISGDILESALVAGVCSQGLDAVLVGVVTTPGVAYLTTSAGASAGVVISASHNPVEDNGIKFFGPDGYKLDDAVETHIEEHVPLFDELPRPTGGEVGRMIRKHEMAWEYAQHVKNAATRKLEGMKIVLDCANGAASELAPQIFSEVGGQVEAFNCSPNGININQSCGSLHPEQLTQKVRELGADVGLAFDGDADRVIMIDERGEIVDGDHVMAIYGLRQARARDLPANAVVGTVMSNIGLEIALAKENVKLIRAPVGDRYVSDEMRRIGAIVGGEKSGHIILSRHTTTGDGMVTALQILSIMVESGKRLSELASEMEEFPQMLVNVPVRERNGWNKVPEIVSAIESAEQKLSGRGRVFVRPSGTEKLIRVMAEGPDRDELESLVNEIADAVRTHFG
ncbi:MAG: phosphoglucosamine mutase [Armatimonadetes bacterium]|nr:phosphoglucosamine mutase [Armatimonadota bacterium]